MKNERFVDRASSRESFSNNFNPRRIEKEKNISYLIVFYVSNRVFHFLQAEIQSKNVTPIFKKHVSKSFDSLLIFIYRACVSYLGIAYECRRVNVTIDREIYRIFLENVARTTGYHSMNDRAKDSTRNA